MGATTFVPLTAELIDEGQFLSDLDVELAELQAALARFRKQFGSKADGAKAKLTIEIECKIEDVDSEAYSIKTSMKVTHPKKPASVSLAMEGFTDEGKLALFVRQSGSDDDNPRQMKLATRDGRAIDEATGKPYED